MPELHFWRDTSGNEIDVVVERGGRLLALEVKLDRTIAGDWLDAHMGNAAQRLLGRGNAGSGL